MIARQGFGFGHVEGGCVEPAALQGCQQRVVIDDAPARGVYQHGRLLHQAQLAPADHTPRLIGQRHVQGHKIRLLEQLVELDVAHVEIGFGLGVAPTVVVQDGHVEGKGAARYLVADAAQPDDSEDLVVNLLPQHEARIVGHKIRAARKAVALDQVAGTGQEEGEGHIGRRAVEDVGRVAYGDAALLGRLQVNVINAHAEVADDAEFGHEIHVCGCEGIVAVVVHPFDGARGVRPGAAGAMDSSARSRRGPQS